MSSNQKQAPTLAPPQQRFSNSQGPTYLQRPPTPHRSEGFHATTPPATYVQPPPLNQPPNQGQGLRGMAPAGPPTQASTPPQSELKVQQIPQQPQTMPITFVQQQPVRGGTQGFYTRPAPPQNQNTQRMSNPHRQQMPMYPQQAVQMYPNPMGQVYISNQIPFPFNGTPRTQNFLPPYQIMSGQTICPTYPQTQPQPYYYPPPQMQMQSRLGPPQQVAAAPPNPAQVPAPANIPLNQPQNQTQQQPVKRRRANALTIIDPISGKDKSKEIYEGDEPSPPASGESSARGTPQPTAVNNNSKEEVQAAFAAQVAQVLINDNAASTNMLEHQESAPVAGHQPMHIESYLTSQQSFNVASMPIRDGKLELAQTSKLVPTREFIPASATASNINVKITPVVSAITDAVEVTITNKIPKDRESPVKGRRSRESAVQPQQQQSPPPVREHREHVVTNKEFISNESYAPKEHVQSQPPKEQTVKEIKEEASHIKDNTVHEVSALAQAAQNREPVDVKGGKGFKGKHVSETKTTSSEQKIPSCIINPSATTVTPSSVVLDKLPESVPAVTSTNVPDLAAGAASGRTKTNVSQKTKDSSIKQISSQQPTAALADVAVASVKSTSAPIVPAVPVSQPSKPTNKTNKMRDLNIRGANKEGTDMDAFSTSESAPAVFDAVENSIAVSAPILDAKPTPPTAEETNVPTICNKPSEAKTLPKHKVDVTSIVKDVPKPLNLPPALPPESQDETDRALNANEKLVQARNEANAKAYAGDNNGDGGVINRPKLPYRDDQWSPLNKDGKKVYDKEFLVLLQNDPKSKKKPDNLPDLDVVLKDNKPRMGGDVRYRMQNDFAPNYAIKSQSQRGPMQKRNSQQGKIANKGGKQNVIHVTLSLHEDVKLRETDNAWKPTRMNSSSAQTDEEKKTAELYKKVRGVLNKLTPQKFKTLVSQVRELQINNKERLQGVINLVFEKAVDEPNFSVAYALMCSELALMQVPDKADGAPGTDNVNFRKLLVTRCQLEFEKNTAEETARVNKLKVIEECTDPEKKKELQLALDDDERRMRQKSVGNVRFIGELYKQQMLTHRIMLRCMTNLLRDKDEESLECLCKLLSTIGKDIESSKKDEMVPLFQTIKEIVDKKHGQISSRVRFMLQDVIDLKESRWVPRRQDMNPKTMDQIQKEAESEQLNIQTMNSMPINTARKDDRGSNVGSNFGNKRKNVSDDGWSTATSRGRTPYSVESSKLKNKPPPMDEIQLGSSTFFGSWSRGSNIKNAINPTNTTNMYAALEYIDTDKRPIESRSNNKGPYSSKGPSMERNYKTYEDGRGSRNSSQHRSRDSSVNSQRSASMTATPPQPQPVVASVPKPSVPAPEVKELTPDQLNRRITNILEEYFNDFSTLADCSTEIVNCVPVDAHPQMVSDCFNNVLERSSTGRQKAGTLLAQLIKMGTLSLENYCKALEELLSGIEDLIIDIPKIFHYLAELIVPLLTEGAFSLQRLKQSFEVLIPLGHAPKLLNLLIKLLIEQKGPNFVQESWQTSGLQLNDFFKPQMEEDDVNKFIKENELEFLVSGGNAPAVHSQLTNEQIHDKLLEFFKDDASYDDIIKWINANLDNRVQDVQFVRTLMTAICEDSIVNSRLKQETLMKHIVLIRRYVDCNANLELHCLYALQALINKLEHPGGILLTIFDRLWTDNIFAGDSFIAWENSTDPAEHEGKGVALKQLTSFFTSLKEVDEESYTSDEA